MRLRTLCLLLFCTAIYAVGQERLWQLHRYDETNSALEGHTTQMLQDRSGLLWIATWNGVYRFDGYEFQRIRPKAEDNCTMTSDRIRDIWLAQNGDIYVKSEETLYRLDTKTYRFHDIKDETELNDALLQRDSQPTRGRFNNGLVEYTDPQGLKWLFRDNALYCMSEVESPAKMLPLERPAMVRCLMMDSKKRIWLTTKEDATLQLLDSKGNRIGYMGPDGSLSPAYRSFGQPVYCITETSDGHLWMGSKPGGLYRLTQTSTDTQTPKFTVENISGLENPNVYGIAEDSRHRLWIATLGGGIACMEHPGDDKPAIINHLPGFPKGSCERVRHIHITKQGQLLAPTTEGLITADTNIDPKNMVFHRHTKDPGRANSLSCNAVMDVAETVDGRLFLTTETGGLNEITSPDLMADTLSFRHYDMAGGLLPTDMTISMTVTHDSHLFIVGNSKVIMLNISNGTFESLGHLFFHQLHHFSEVRPLMMPDGDWLIATTEGALLLPASAAHRSSYQPPLLITSITFANHEQPQLAVTSLDTLRLKPSERSLTIQFAALDYVEPQAINYQYKMGTDSTSQWNNLGHAHSITLLDLKPETYLLSLRSTNADGMWTNNVRTLTIIVEPVFWETIWAHLLLALLVVAIIAGIVYTYFYIRAINRKQHETLEKYLTLLEESKKWDEDTMTANREPIADSPLDPQGRLRSPSEQELPTAWNQGLPPDDDPFMHRVLEFVEQNLSNGEADIGQMADACAVSRSVLQRRMKQMMGVTPIDFLREARLKHACKLLRTTDMAVSDVAYKCGFNDPKYFSRCFRQSIGMSPSEYKLRNDL